MCGVRKIRKVKFRQAPKIVVRSAPGTLFGGEGGSNDPVSLWCQSLGGCTQTALGHTSPPIALAPNGLLGGLKNSSTSTKLPPQSFTVPRFSSASPPPHNATQSRSSGIHHHGRAHPQQASRLEHGAVSLLH